MNLRVSVVIISLVFSGVVKSENLLDIYKLAFENDATFQAAKYQYAAQKKRCLKRGQACCLILPSKLSI